MLGMLVGYALVFNALAATATTGLRLPGWGTLLLVALSGACTAGGHRLQLLATRLSPANHIAPTHYSQIVWAVAIGAVFFSEVPDWVSFVGLAVVVASGVLTLMREQVRLGTVRWNPLARTRL
jgi:drug/metabolite transporter (DMT)-like permease